MSENEDLRISSTICKMWIYQCQVCEFTVEDDESEMINHVMIEHVTAIEVDDK